MVYAPSMTVGVVVNIILSHFDEEGAIYFVPLQRGNHQIDTYCARSFAKVQPTSPLSLPSILEIKPDYFYRQ
jgi:hypothetical protein